MDESKHTSPAAAAQPAKRMLRGHQPARAILLDLSHSVEVQVWHRVLSSLHGLLSLVCNMAGPPRIPLISFYVLDAYPEVILPFSPPKGNLCRMLCALRDVKTYLEERQVYATTRPPACVHQGVIEACGQYRRHLNAMGHLQGGGGGSLQMDQLEVVVLSGATVTDARALVDCHDTQLDLTLLKRLVVLVLTPTTLDDSESPQSSNSNSKDPEDSGIMDIVHLDTVDGDLSLKCDIVERIINPTQLPHHEFFNLHSDSAHCKTVFPCPSKAAGLTVPVYCLTVIAILPLHALCDSLLFGLPLIVQATSCWRIDWEELEDNTANFHALCNELSVKNQVLLTQLHHPHKPPPPPPNTTTTNTRHHHPPRDSTTTTTTTTTTPKIQGMFVLMPAPGGSSLLLKALATRELLLPATWAAAAAAATPGDGEGGGSSQNTLRVQSSLTQVPELSSYNPLSYSSGLVEVLLSQAAPKQQAVRPRPAAKRKAQPAIKQEQPGAQERTWSELPPFVTPAERRWEVGVSPTTTPRGGYSPSPCRRGQTPVGSSVAVGRNRVTTRLPDGFLVQLE